MHACMRLRPPTQPDNEHLENENLENENLVTESVGSTSEPADEQPMVQIIEAKMTAAVQVIDIDESFRFKKEIEGSMS